MKATGQHLDKKSLSISRKPRVILVDNYSTKASRLIDLKYFSHMAAILSNPPPSLPWSTSRSGTVHPTLYTSPHPTTIPSATHAHTNATRSTTAPRHATQSQKREAMSNSNEAVYSITSAAAVALTLTMASHVCCISVMMPSVRINRMK